MRTITLIQVAILVFTTTVTTLAQPDSRFRQPHGNNQFEVLLYTHPDYWHNLSEPAAITEFQQMAQRHAFGLTWTTLRDQFSEDALSQFDVVVFLHSTTRDFNEEQLESFKRFIRNGGGFVGIHATSACAEEGEWFRKLVGRVFNGHPREQTAVMHVLNKNHPSTMHLPDRWIWTDEWYSYKDPVSENLIDLITLDESTYDPGRTGDENWTTAMGDHHPIAWCQDYDGGRSFYTTLGHMPALYRDVWFLDHIYGGIYWAATGLGFYKD
jgi:type 1 glutamine amidotransferase